MFRLAQKENLIIPAHIDYLASLRDFITQIGKKYHFSHKFVNTFKLAVDEAATNIIKHAYSENEGYITVQAVVKSNSLILKILDQGAYFDPKWAQELDLKKSVNTDEKMGLGIFMMRKLMDEVDYKKSSSGNELTLTKKDKFKKSKLQLFNLASLPTALKIRYLVHALLFVMVLNGAGYYYYYKSANTDVEIDFIQSGQKISKQVTQQLCAIKPEILNGPDGLSYLKAIILPIYDEHLGRIYSLSLEDSLGFIAWSTIPTELNSSFKRPDFYTNYEENIFNYSIGSENAVYEFESDLVFKTGKALYKKLHVLVSSNYLKHEIKRKQITYLKYVLISLGLCFIIIAFISYFVSHPIHKLTKWVRAAKTGSLLDEMDIDASTEIGEIAQAFSDITEKFNQSQKHLAVREKFEKEINLAKDIQHSLLPKEIPEIDTLEISAYYEAAKTVGGDFYDFIEVDQDHIGIAIADVSGKGVPGSLMMTIIRTALRTEARGSNDAAEVLIRVNDFVVNDMKSGMFATIFYVIINTKTLVANFASAGHNPLILHSRSKKRSFNLNPSGFPVGIKLPIKDYFAQNIKAETIQLAQDELVLLYTDGITEAMNPAKQLYGEERLINIITKSTNLTVKKFTEKLKNSIYSFTEDGALHDDITFIALKPKKKTTNDIEYDPSLSVNVNFISIDDSNKIIDIVCNDPNLGAEGISQKLNSKKYGKLELEPERVLSELSKRQLHTVALRLKYVESKNKTRFSQGKPGTETIIPIFTETPTTHKNKKPSEENISVSPPPEDSGMLLNDFLEVMQPDAPTTAENQKEKKIPADSSNSTESIAITDSVETPETEELSITAEESEIIELEAPTKPEDALTTDAPSKAEIIYLPGTIEDQKNTESPEISKELPSGEVDGIEKSPKTQTDQIESIEPEKIENEDMDEFEISDNEDISDLLVDSIFDKLLTEVLTEDTLKPSPENNTQQDEDFAEINESDSSVVKEVETENVDSEIEGALEEKSTPDDEAPKDEQLETEPEPSKEIVERTTPDSDNKPGPAKIPEEIEDKKSGTKRKKTKRKKTKRKTETETTQIELTPFVAPSEKDQSQFEYEFILGNASELIGFEISEEHDFEDLYDFSSDLDIEFKREQDLEEYELVLDLRHDEDDDFEEETTTNKIEATSKAIIEEPREVKLENDAATPPIEEPVIEEIGETKSVESVDHEQVEATPPSINIDDVEKDEIETGTLQTEEIAENPFVNAALDDAINFSEIDELISDEATSANTEQESLTESDAQPDNTAISTPAEAGTSDPQLNEDIPPQTENTENFGLELFADLDVYDDDTFAQDLAEFDQPIQEEKTPKESSVQKPHPFSELQINELEDIYRIRPYPKSQLQEPEASATEAKESSEIQEPKTEPLHVKAQIIEEPISEPVEISSEHTDSTEPEAEPSALDENTEEQEVVVQHLDGIHTEEPPTEDTEAVSSKEEELTLDVSSETETETEVEKSPILQGDVTEETISSELEGAESSLDDEETPVITEEISFQQPVKQFPGTPFISLKTNEIEDKYANDIELKQSKVIKHGSTDSPIIQQETHINTKPQVTETIEVEVRTSQDELTTETELTQTPTIEPQDKTPIAEPVAEKTEPEITAPEPEQIVPPKTTQPKDELSDYLMTGVKHYKNKEYEDAIIFLKKVIRLDPNVKEAFAMLGNAYYRNGMLYEAIMTYEQLQPHNLKDPSIYENLGLIYWKLNQKKKAVSAWQSLLSLTPERADIKKRIDFLEQNGTQELKTQIRKISLKQNGKTINNVSDTDKQSILKKAIEQYRSQDYKSAIDSLKLALEHFPEHTEVYTYLANAYFRNSMFDDAVKIYERLKQLDENNTNVLESLGMLHLKQGAFKQAVAEWQNVVNKQPGRADLKQKIAKVSELIEDN